MVEVEKEIYYITAEQMQKVNTYLPISIKRQWVSYVAEKCIEAMPLIATSNEKEMDLPLPNVCKENLELKSRYLMGAFVKLYLLGNFTPDDAQDDALMPEDEYDKWAGGHIFAQIEKFKSDKNLRDTCFNLLNDYKDLERRLNAECHALLTAVNDPVARQLVAMQASVTPDSVQELMSSINELKEKKGLVGANEQS